MLDNKIFQSLLVFFGSFIGQLIVRMTSLDGSLDKWWLLIPPLSVPPLSIVPTYLIYKDKVEKGHGGVPYDMYVLIPILLSIISGYIVEKKYFMLGPKGSLIKYAVNFISFALALYLRDFNNCILKKSNSNEPPSIPYSKIFAQSAFISLFIPLLPYFLVKLPYVNPTIDIVGKMSPYFSILLDILFKLLSIVIAYLAFNMFNGVNKDKTCKDKYSIRSVILIMIISIVVNLLVSNKAELIPYNLLELNPPSNIETPIAS